MNKGRLRTIPTKYWRPGENYLEHIVESIQRKVTDGDFVVLSEKAISTALGNIVDESKVKTTLSAKLIAGFWMRTVWGFLLGPQCHFPRRLLQRIREYPNEFGGRHKQVALQYVGLLDALMFGSEGGIDGSNLPYSYVSLALPDPSKIADQVREEIRRRLGKRVFVMITDTDKTYSLGKFHFTPRHSAVAGIHSSVGLVAYVLGRMFRLQKRATPLTISGCKMSAEDALEISEAANRARGYGAGKNVWDMTERFGVDFAAVSWEMLETVRHKPIVIVRTKR